MPFFRNESSVGEANYSFQSLCKIQEEKATWIFDALSGNIEVICGS